LFENVCAVLEQRRPRAELEASRHTLALITSGEQHATLSYGPVVLSGRWLWHVKDWIDRRFMERDA
jgi:selenide,water dikinase